MRGVVLNGDMFFSPDPIYCIGRKKSVVFFRMQTKTRPHHLLFLEPNYFNSFILSRMKTFETHHPDTNTIVGMVLKAVKDLPNTFFGL